MLSNCQETLENDRLIASLKRDDALAEKSVYHCLKQLFRQTYLRLLIPPTNDDRYLAMQQKLAEETFNDAFLDFRQNIRNGSFTAEGDGKPRAAAGGYFYKILWRKFRRENMKPQNEHTLPLFGSATGTPVSVSQDMPVFNTNNGIEKMMTHCIGLLGEECRRYMKLQYIEKKDTEEIIGMVTNKTPGTVRKDLAKCRTAFQEKIKMTYGIDF